MSEIKVTGEITVSYVEDGEQGVSVSYIKDQYYISTSSAALEGGEWLYTLSSWSAEAYVWRRLETTYSDGTVTTSDPYYDPTYTISVGGVNLVDGSNDASKFSAYSGATLTKSVVSEFGYDDANKIVSSGGTSTLKAIFSYGAISSGSVVSESIYLKNNSTVDSIECRSNLGSMIQEIAPGESMRVKFSNIIGNGSTTLQIQLRALSADNNIDLTWSRIQIENGSIITDWSLSNNDVLGITIESIIVEYSQSSSSSTAPTTGWSTTSPTWVDGMYVWQRTRTTYKDNTYDLSEAVCLSGAKGDIGKSTVYRGDFSSSEIYYNTDTRADIVKYSDTYYIYIGESGVSGEWNSSNWENFGADFDNIATGLLFAENAIIEILQGTKFYVKDSSGDVVGSLQGSDYPLWLGGDSADSSTFRVNKDGVMTATNANVSGTVNTKVLNVEIVNSSNYLDTLIINSDEASFIQLSNGGREYTLSAPTMQGKSMKFYWWHGITKLETDSVYITGGFRDLTASTTEGIDVVYYNLSLSALTSGYVELISISSSSPSWALVSKTTAIVLG